MHKSLYAHVVRYCRPKRRFRIRPGRIMIAAPSEEAAQRVARDLLNRVRLGLLLG